MRDKTELVVKPGRNLDYQILICGLMLVLQLFAGEDQKHDIFTTYYHCEDTFHFNIIEKRRSRSGSPMSLPLSTPSKRSSEGKPAPGWGNCSKASTSHCCRKRHSSPKNVPP